MEQIRKHAFSELCDIYKGVEPGKVTALVLNGPTVEGGVTKGELNIGMASNRPAGGIFL